MAIHLNSVLTAAALSSPPRIVRQAAKGLIIGFVVVFGVVALLSITVREYPDIDPPVVSIGTNYAGASAAIVETQITQGACAYPITSSTVMGWIA